MGFRWIPWISQLPANRSWCPHAWRTSNHAPIYAKLDTNESGFAKSSWRDDCNPTNGSLLPNGNASHQGTRAQTLTERAHSLRGDYGFRSIGRVLGQQTPNRVRESLLEVSQVLAGEPLPAGL